jgi:hypothetical protein
MNQPLMSGSSPLLRATSGLSFTDRRNSLQKRLSKVIWKASADGVDDRRARRSRVLESETKAQTRRAMCPVL